MPDPTPILLVVTTLLLTSFACHGLLALWAATSPRHWLLRCAVVLAALSPLVLVPAYEPWALLALQACTVAAGITIWRWRTARRQEDGEPEDLARSRRRFPIQFSIHTLLALTGLVAMLTPILVPLIRNTPASAEAWMETAFAGVFGGCAVLIGAWLRTARRKWLAWLAAALLCLVFAAIAVWFDLWFMSLMFDFSQSLAALSWLVVFALLPVMTWLLLSLWFAGRTTSAGCSFARARQIVARCSFCVLLVALALPTAYVVWQLAHPLPVPDLPVPQPNGIADIVAAGNAFFASPILITTVEPKSTEELAAEIAKYAGDYERLRLGLTRDVLTVIWTKDGEIDTATLYSMGPTTTRQAVRQAARGLMREGQLAQQQKRYGDAARIALDNMHLGQAVTRDALLVDYLVGVAVKGIGDQSLYQVLPQLNAGEYRETIAALEGIERRRESIHDVLYRERVCSENMVGWPYHLFELVNRLASTDHREGMLGASDREQAKTRLLIAELALRAHQLKHRTLPDQLEQLTPEFLTELPIDPFDPDGRPLRYVRTDDGYVLYSIGHNGKDDGGQPPARSRSGAYELTSDGDLRLDVFFSRDDDVEDAGDAQPNE